MSSRAPCLFRSLLLACSPGGRAFSDRRGVNLKLPVRQAVIGSGSSSLQRCWYMCAVKCGAMSVPMLPGTCSLFQAVLCAVQETHECLK